MVTIDDIWLRLEKLDKLDEITELINKLSTICSEIQMKHERLEKRVNLITEENKQLKTQIEIVNCELDRMKQHTLNSNIEIAGVPETVDECPKEITENILQHLGFTEVDTIKNVYRKKGYKNRAGLPQPIIVTIRDKGTRDQILKTKRNLESNLYSDITLPSKGSDKRIIYLNEHLTNHNKYLLKQNKGSTTLWKNI